MALAYPGPADHRDAATSPSPDAERPAGPGVPLRRRVPRRVEFSAIARGFAVAAPGIPELRRPRERTWVLLAATDLFEAWAIGWPPGGQIELHDHGTSSGAVAVAAGALTETTVHPTDGGTTLVARRRLCAGELRRFGPGHIHDLINEDGDPAVSVHVYGPRLEAMSFYRVTGGGRLEVVRTDQVTPVGPFDTAGAHDPG